MKKKRNADFMDFTVLMGARLRTLRKVHRKTQAEIASLLELDRTSLSYFENGKNAMSLYHMAILARYYRVPLDLIVGDRLAFEQYVRGCDDG